MSCLFEVLGNTAQFPPSGLSTAPADLRAKSRRKASVALRSASLRLGVRHGICVAKMLDNVGLRYPHRTSGTKAPRTLRPLPLLRFAVSATGGAHLCSTKYYLHFWLSSCRTSLTVSALRIMRYCPYTKRAKSKTSLLYHAATAHTREKTARFRQISRQNVFLPSLVPKFDDSRKL